MLFYYFFFLCVCVCRGDRLVMICGVFILKIDVVSPLPVAGTVATTTPTITVTSGEKVYGCMGAWGYGCRQEKLSNIYLRLRVSNSPCITTLTPALGAGTTVQGVEFAL